MPLISLDTPWKHQKTRGFLMFSGGIKRVQWHEMGKAKRWHELICVESQTKFDPFQDNAFLLYPPERSGNLWFSDAFRGYRKRSVSWNWLKSWIVSILPWLKGGVATSKNSVTERVGFLQERGISLERMLLCNVILRRQEHLFYLLPAMVLKQKHTEILC